MKKLLIGGIAVVAIIVIVIVANFAMQKATASKAEQLIERAMRDTYYDEWDYKSAYINPITKTLYIKEFEIEDEIYLDFVKISKFKEDDDTVSANVLIKGFDYSRSRQRYMRADLIRIDNLVLMMDDYYYDEWVPKSLSGVQISKFRMRDYETRINIGEGKLKGNIKVPRNMFDYTSMLSELDTDLSIKDFSIVVNDSKPIVISSIKSVSKRKGDKLTQDFSIDGGKLFTMKGNSVVLMGGDLKLSEEDMEDYMYYAEMMGLGELGRMQLQSFHVTYEDKGFFNAMLKTIEESAGERNLRQQMLDELEYEEFDYFANGEELKKLIVEFINTPGKVIIDGKPLEGQTGAPFMAMMDGDFLDMFNVSVQVNKSDMLVLKKNPDYDPWGWGDDYGYDESYGGMVVDFLEYDEEDGVCYFESTYNGGEIYFYCSSSDVNYFNTHEGPFYIEYDYYYDIIYRTDNGEEYEDWDSSDDYGDYDYDDYDYDTAGGVIVNFMGSEHDKEYDEYVCSFSSYQGSGNYYFYCDEYDVEYFEENEGPFYVEYDYYDTITGYTTDWQDYEEWTE